MYIRAFHFIFNIDEIIHIYTLNPKPFLILQILIEKLCKSIKNYNLRHLHNHQHKKEYKYLLNFPINSLSSRPENY